MIIYKSELKTNQARHIKHNNVDHVVVPVVMVVEGVLNNTLVLMKELESSLMGWNDRPVVINHPEVHGEYISAGSPDIIEKSTIGRVYNAQIKGDKLVAELWLETQKAERVGQSALLKALENNETIEVSTGFFAAGEKKTGEFKGQSYTEVSRGIVPDHLALLPNAVGACSVEGGCGTNVNVFTNLARRLFGLRTNGDNSMCTREDRVNKLVGNSQLSADDKKNLMEMSDKDFDLLETLLTANNKDKDKEMNEDEDKDKDKEMNEDEDKEEKMSANQVQEMIDEALRKQSNQGIVARIKANARNVLSDAALNGMGQEDLEKYEATLRDVDYSGAGGPIVNQTHNGGDTAPMQPNGGLVSMIRNEKREA